MALCTVQRITVCKKTELQTLRKLLATLVEASGDLWSMSGEFITAPPCRAQTTFVCTDSVIVPNPIPSEYIDVVRQTKTHLGQSGSERRVGGSWNVGVS